MKNEIEENIRKGFDTAFINAYSDSNLAYRPEFICNDYSKGEKVLSTIENELKNIQIKMYYVNQGDPGFHTKGYWFKQDEIYKILIGSSNLTQCAITKNKEWNTKIVAIQDWC